MPLHHPNENILVEFSAGTLPLAQAVAVKAHLHFCSECQQSVQKMEAYGGSMLEKLEPQPTMVGGFDKLMGAIDGGMPAKVESVRADNTISEPSGDNTGLPTLIQKMIENKPLKWKKVNRSLKTAPLTIGQKQFQVSLQKIEAGNTVPKHDHRGTEMTVVLEGSFSDKQGIYQEGDFLIKEPGDVHQPISARNQHCLCLSVEEAPVKLTGLWGRLINPFIKLHAA